MWTDAGCFGAMFLGLTALVATLALRSLWKFRHEPPLTPLRIVLLLLLMIGGGLLPVVLRIESPGMFLAMAGGVFVASVGWLIARGL